MTVEDEIIDNAWQGRSLNTLTWDDIQHGLRVRKRTTAIRNVSVTLLLKQRGNQEQSLGISRPLPRRSVFDVFSEQESKPKQSREEEASSSSSSSSANEKSDASSAGKMRGVCCYFKHGSTLLFSSEQHTTSKSESPRRMTSPSQQQRLAIATETNTLIKVRGAPYCSASSNSFTVMIF